MRCISSGAQLINQMVPIDPMDDDRVFQSRAIQASIRIGLIGILAFWSFRIVEPFIDLILWAAIIAVATQPIYRLVLRWFRGRAVLSAVLIVLFDFVVLIGPTAALATNLVQTVSALSLELRTGALSVPPPPVSIEHWPFIGEQLYSFWEKASQNLSSVFGLLSPHLQDIALWLLHAASATGLGIAKFVLSIIIAGAFLANEDRVSKAVKNVATRLTGERGPELTRIAGITVQSVTRGVLGVAVVQSLITGLAMLLIKVPASGLWAFSVLILSVLQLPTLLILVPVIVYVFFERTLGVAIPFTILVGIIGLSDTPLRTLFIGRAKNVPMLVIFMGAIGGGLLQGIIGLFVGAVVLALGYTLLLSWVNKGRVGDEQEASPLPDKST